MKKLLSAVVVVCSIIGCSNPADVAKEIKENSPLTICYATSELSGSPGDVKIYTAHVSGITITKDETATSAICIVPLGQCREVEITDGQMLIAYYKTGEKVSIVAHKGQYWNL